MSTHAYSELEPFADLIGKLSPQKIAETADVPVELVEAWIAERTAAPKAEQPAAKRGSKAQAVAVPVPEPPKPARKVAAIKVLVTTAISIETKTGRRLKLPVPRSIYRGAIAQKYAALLKPSEYRVVAWAE